MEKPTDTLHPMKFSGYHQPKERPVEELTARVGPGTPCGEYMRRYWHPFLLSSQLDHRPKVVRVLGEDLVLYRDLSGDLGLVHKHCAHRGASLEFGIIAEHGIRCCYHGWLFGNDGTILETPGEPPESPHRHKYCQGAYPVVEFQGVIFTYMGPPAIKPAFPMMDAMVMPDNQMKPYLIHSPCNWQQVSENSMDPFHVAFLHTRVSGPQFSEVFATLPIIEYYDTPHGFFYTNARRVGDFVWIRMHDHLVPNFSQNGAIFENVSHVRYFGRPGLTRWVTPLGHLADSIRLLLKLMRDAGAREIHMRISCPPTIAPCYYGVDTPNREELIAAHKSVEEIRQFLGADSLGYLSHKGLLDAVGDAGQERHCTACYTGKYPTKVGELTNIEVRTSPTNAVASEDGARE